MSATPGSGSVGSGGPSGIVSVGRPGRPLVSPSLGRTNYALTGVTRDSTGAALGLCVVQLYSSATDTVSQTTTSDASGNFSFVVAHSSTVKYWAKATDAGGHYVGCTLNNLWSGSQGTTPAPTASPWYPNQESTNVAWIDNKDWSVLFANGAGTTYAAHNGKVARLRDKGVRQILTGGVLQATSGLQPTWNAASQTLSEHSTLTFVPDLLMTAVFTGSVTIAQPYTRVIIVNQTGSVAQYRAICDGGTNASSLVRNDISTGFVLGYCGGPGVASTTLSVSGVCVVTMLANGASSKLWVNGALACSGNFGSAALDGITIGCMQGGSLGMNGEFYEDFVFTGDQDASGLRAGAISTYTNLWYGRSA